MNTITVSASKKYDVMIDSKLLSSIGNHVASVTGVGKAAIISDSNVWPIYGQIVESSLTAAGFSVISYVIPAGESSKNGQVYLQVLEFLAQNKLTRSDCIIALGGGVVGDLAGFTAATYLRGISYIQVPTTLLAMVDSSVGGKTAIDLTAGKNLVGAFYQPKLVLCDTSVLDSLPDEVFRDGCAEVIKYGILYDDKLFDHLSDKGLAFDRTSVISRCVELKRDVVMEDEFDTGTRMKLNLGHTIGHAVESRSNYSVSHGKAVAIGTAIITKAAVSMGMCDEGTYIMILDILKTFSLPVCTGYSSQELYASALSDKKRAGGTVNLIIPKAIGHCDICPTPVEQVKALIEAGL